MYKVSFPSSHQLLPAHSLQRGFCDGHRRGIRRFLFLEALQRLV